MKLEVNKEYKLCYSGEFFHAVGKRRFTQLDADNSFEAVFVGTITTSQGDRNIFIDKSNPFSPIYCMYGADNLNYILK